ncbi:MAG TPA: AAA family ATPase [Acidimicrobiales bacterium]|nr:AAA family ATPase [Acidimicrobiales bacterium]
MPKVQLVELYAHGLGVIDDARLEFGPGFNVITGETGAGKTLLLGALGICLGSDASASRYALTSDTRTAALFLRDANEEIVFSRETTSAGRLRSSLNGAPSSVEALRGLADELIVVHGQHDSLALRSRSETVRLIDESGGVETKDLDDVRSKLRDVRQLRDGFGGDLTSRQRELEFLDFQLGELDTVAIQSSAELSETLEELTRLSSLRDGQTALVEVLALFDGDSDDAVLTLFARSLARLPVGEAYEAVRMSLLGSLVQAREALSDLAALGDPDVFDPATLATLEERTSVLQQIARKYGGTLEAALATGVELRARYERCTSESARVAQVDQEIRLLEESETTLARRVKQEREFAAAQLTNAVRGQLARVALANSSLRFVVDGDDGSDAQIFFTPNPGLPEGPLATLASGGELSRVLLALSLETAREDVVAVFDEVDAGLGGQVAQQIGECLYEVGRYQQVLAVTHLASVAARADHHFVIEKKVERGVTKTTVRSLSGDERVREIARMLAGDEVTSESRALAQQLLENSSEVRAEADFSH